MTNIKNELQEYKSIPRSLVFDESLSDRARFVYIYMACKPSDWEFFIEPMAKEIGYSTDTLRKYLGELVDSGWIEKCGQQKENGVFGAVKYIIKATKFSVTEIFRDGKIPTLHNKDILLNEDNDSNKELIDKSIIKKTPKSLDFSFVDERFMPAVQKWLDYKKEKRQTYKQIGFKIFYEKLVRLSSGDPDVAMVIIEQSMANNYAGIFAVGQKAIADSYPLSPESVNTEDIMGSYAFFVPWMHKKCERVLNGIRIGFPKNDKEYKMLLSHTVGGARGLAYVMLVLQRDGWKDYDDSRGFMWIYSNYIKKNGLFKD